MPSVWLNICYMIHEAPWFFIVSFPERLVLQTMENCYLWTPFGALRMGRINSGQVAPGDTSKTKAAGKHTQNPVNQ